MNYQDAFINIAKSLKIEPIDSDVSHVGTIAGLPSPRLLDRKEHFPVITETQARSAISRASKLREIPMWYGGTLTELREDIFSGIAKIHPDLATALSDGKTKPDTSVKKITDPADVVKNQVPSVKRPHLTSAELAKICENEQARIALAGKLMECIEQQELDVQNAKKMASTLLKKGLTAEQFDVLGTYLQSDIMRELLHNQHSSATASVRRQELLNRFKGE